MKQTEVTKLKTELVYFKKEMEKYKKLLLDDGGMDKEEEAKVQDIFERLMNAEVAVDNIEDKQIIHDKYHEKITLTIKVKEDIDSVSIIEQESKSIIRTVNSSTEKIEIPGSIIFNGIGYNNYSIKITYSDQSVEHFSLKLDPMIPYYHLTLGLEFSTDAIIRLHNKDYSQAQTLLTQKIETWISGVHEKMQDIELAFSQGEKEEGIEIPLVSDILTTVIESSKINVFIVITDYVIGKVIKKIEASGGTKIKFYELRDIIEIELESYKIKIKNNSLEYWTKFIYDQGYTKDKEGNIIGVNFARIKSDIIEYINQFPKSDFLAKKLVNSFIESSEDGDDWDNDGTLVAGYIEFQLVFNSKSNSFGRSFVFFDDISNPDGVKKALIRLHGKEKPLVELNFDMQIWLLDHAYSSKVSILEKYKGKAKWKRMSGGDTLTNDMEEKVIKEIKKLTINDLQAD
jgi:hypothetical protein